MSLQFNEFYNHRTGLTVGINRLLFSRQTKYQLVEVYETDTWGNLMVIDGMVMLSEKDEFVYHEMLSHVGIHTHPNPERVLIIGGGDGGTAREVMKHSAVNEVDMVEIDRSVVEASKQFLPQVGDFDNPKLNVIYDDGIKFVQTCTEKYDLIIIDGSDPAGPAEGLFKKEFYQDCRHILDENGILIAQTESPWVSSYHPAIKNMYGLLNDLFAYADMFLCYIPLYPAGMWSMMIASDLHDPGHDSVIKRAEKNVRQLGELQYYSAEVHKAAFALPGFVRNVLQGSD